MKTLVKIDNRASVSFSNPEGINLKAFAARKGFVTRVKTVSNRKSSFFIDLREVSRQEFAEAVAGKEVSSREYTNQYIAGVPAVWNLTYYAR